ncbi:MAG: translation initiation factor IF-2, partial [Syntrophobacteraceae bacterium]|nr:translation initiation factor IF-2 [Syntrophobacteraceae bacterium]
MGRDLAYDLHRLLDGHAHQDHVAVLHLLGHVCGIAHAKAANVPIIVALNKIDRPDANPDFVKKQLSELELVPEEWEGNTMVVPVSAKQKTGIEDLLAGILIVSESANIRANSDGKRFGVVIEAERDKAKGVVATILIQNGTVANGDIVVAGTAHGKIKAMFDFKGKKIQKAGPSTPVSILGLSDVPTAGDVFEVVTSERDAKALAETKKKITQTAAVMPKTTLQDFFAQMQTGEIKELNLIIKADVQGSLEPIISSLKDLSKKDAKINILQAGTGNINESDVLLASASKGVVVGFNVQAENSARRLADVEGVSIRMYDIIYRLMEDVEKALKGMLAPEYREEVLGQANVLAVFK